MPCAKMIMPAPKLLTSLPDASNFKIGGASDILPVARSIHPLLWGVKPPQRSATQIDLPSLSTSTALVEPHVRPSGSFAQPSIDWYGLGRSLVGFMSPCANVSAPITASAAATRPTATGTFTCLKRDIRAS